MGLGNVIAMGFGDTFWSLAVSESGLFGKNVKNCSFLLSCGLIDEKSDFDYGIEPVFVSDLTENVLMVLIFLLIDLGFGTGLVLEFDEVAFLLIELLKTIAIIF